MRSSKVIRTNKPTGDAFQIVVPVHLRSKGPSEEEILVRRLGEAEHSAREAQSALETLEARLAEEAKKRVDEVGAAEARGMEKAAAEVRNAVEALHKVAHNVSRQGDDIVRGAEDTVVRIAIAVAERIVGAVVEKDEGALLRNVREALGRLADQERVVIRLHPDDLEVVNRNQSSCAIDPADADRFDLIADGRIRRGGCLVESDSGDVDARIDSQLAAFEAALREAIR